VEGAEGAGGVNGEAGGGGAEEAVAEREEECTKVG